MTSKSGSVGARFSASSSSRKTPLENLVFSLARTMEGGGLAAIWILFSKAFILQFFRGDIIAQRRTASGIPEVRYLLLLAVLTLAGLLWIHRRAILKWIRHIPLSLWFLTGYIVFSVLWSVRPGESLQKAVLFMASTGLGALLAHRMPHPRSFVPWLAWILAFLMVSSFVMATLFPLRGTYEEIRGTVWIGVFVYKNILGMFSALSLLVAVTWKEKGVMPLLLRIFLGITAGVNLFFSRAAGAQVYLLVTVLVTWPLWKSLRRLSPRALLGVGSLGSIVMVGVLLWVWKHLPEILALMGRDTTLTSRIPLWGAILWTLQRYGRLWIGMGYEAFFGGWASPATRWVWRIVGWRPAQAHSGYVQAIADLGLVGLVLSLWVWATALYRVFLAYRRDPSWTFPLLFMTFLTWMNITETVFTSTSVYATLAIWAVVVWAMLASVRLPVGVGEEKGER